MFRGRSVLSWEQRPEARPTEPGPASMRGGMQWTLRGAESVGLCCTMTLASLHEPACRGCGSCNRSSLGKTPGRGQLRRRLQDSAS